jgi:heme-degrading monooxygenase HmoA
MPNIITRIWHGTTKTEHSDAYLTFLEESGLSDYKRTEGNLSVSVWRRVEGEICHFWTVTKWHSYDDIKKFAGEDYEKARYYPEDAEYLLEYEEKVLHVETFEY